MVKKCLHRIGSAFENREALIHQKALNGFAGRKYNGERLYPKFICGSKAATLHAANGAAFRTRVYPSAVLRTSFPQNLRFSVFKAFGFRPPCKRSCIGERSRAGRKYKRLRLPLVYINILICVFIFVIS
ncbi:hypothetical protein NRC22 [Methanocella arvoryzae MRE50]|uniref:Uncharacterized protein n=1 Tax=Methanocella arvoryzae (strain DSM 22066 / NBRC 105507 / MRE50) TaxID=351160 RepID=Q0W0X6_METAR|nr:hypothetical protein NRC22 [Methanocella arvoryzae MRE50]